MVPVLEALYVFRESCFVRNKSKNKKSKVKHYSWHFWFLHVLTLLALSIGYSIGVESGNVLMSTIVTGLLVYLSPLFLHFIRNFMPKSLMVKFYTKSL